MSDDAVHEKLGKLEATTGYLAEQSKATTESLNGLRSDIERNIASVREIAVTREETSQTSGLILTEIREIRTSLVTRAEITKHEEENKTDFKSSFDRIGALETSRATKAEVATAKQEAIASIDQRHRTFKIAYAAVSGTIVLFFGAILYAAEAFEKLRAVFGSAKLPHD